METGNATAEVAEHSTTISLNLETISSKAKEILSQLATQNAEYTDAWAIATIRSADHMDALAAMQDADLMDVLPTKTTEYDSQDSQSRLSRVDLEDTIVVRDYI